MIRKLPKVRDYENHYIEVPAYSFIDNFFYFPKKNWFQSSNVFNKGIINHEVGHYLHNQINPMLKERAFLQLENREEFKEKRRDQKRLVELVAEYGNFILGIMDYMGSIKSYKSLLKKELEVYKKYGASFLPYLARMDLETARKKGITDTLNYNPKP